MRSTMTAVSDTPPGGVGRRAASPVPVAARPTPTPEVSDDETTDVAARPSARRMFTPPAFLLELQEGSPVGEYLIQAQIGEGAMGTVYSAVHPLIGKTVAIKVLKAELCANQQSIDRFVQEAQTVNRIGHPNIVDVFSLGELPDGRAYYVMEWLRGEDLRTRLARGPMKVSDACEILDGICRALLAAHAKDIVHRDLKPDNVFLHQVDKGPMMVKLLDFGIAKLMRAQMKIEKTQTGSMLGTPRYISPEQARGIDVDARTDIYSLGVIAYEMLAGRPPFQGETAMDLVVKHLSEPVPPLSQLVRVPKPLETCVMRMLEKMPANRPSLDLVQVTLVDPNRRFPVLKRRFSWRVPIAALVLAAAVGAGLVSWKLVRDAGESAAPEIANAPPPAPVPPPKPAPPPAPPVVATLDGTLDVKISGATDASVSVDGMPWPRAAAIVPGEHAIEVRAPGRPMVEQHVNVEPGQTFTITIVVPPKPAVGRPAPRPVPRPAPPKPPVKPPANDDDLLKPKGHK